MSEGFGQIPMDEERLKKYGANQARGLQPQGFIRPRGLARQLEGELRQLEDIRRSLEEGLGGESTLTSGGEWLLDNGYLAEREGRWACDALGQRGRIRRCGEGTVLMACAHGAVFALPQLDRHRLGCYLNGFQRVTPLTEGELCLLVPALVCALVEQLVTLTEGDRGLDSPQLGHQLGLIFGGLRTVGVTEWGSFLEGQSQVDAILRRDPAGIYAKMEEGTRHHYRHILCNHARAKGLGEVDYARQILAQAGDGHVGSVLFVQEDRGWGGLYGGAILSLTLILTATAGWMLKSWLVTLLLAFPISDLVKNVVDFLATRLAHPRLICRMELEEGIPQEGRTLCVIAALVTGTGCGLTAQLEGYYLANRDSGNQLRLGVLADLPDSQSPMGEEQWKKIRVLQQEIAKLNQKYENCFYLFFRPPVLQNQDKIYQGWERKRGALVELNRLILNKKTNLFVMAGENSWLCDVKYVITLDSDTALTVGSAREMVGGMLHPLNRPVLDERRRVVVGGYGLLQPRVSVSLHSANRTLFSRVFGGQGGIDPYGSTASEVYHDLFDSASYTGKGIYDVQMFDACLDGRFPDNTILSHDLLEGSYLRCGLLSQVELTDGVPAGVDGYFARQNRWVRGDWQLLPWLRNTVPDGDGGQEKNPLSPLARWKIADNLRRSLSPLFTLIPLILGVCFSDLVFALAGGVAVLAAASNLLLSGVELTARRGTSTHVRYHSTVIFGLAGAILQTLLQLILLPYQAYVSTRGALTALYRSFISKKKRLEWVTAAQTEGKKGTIFYYYRRQWCAVLVGLLTVVGADVRFGGLVGLVWMASPALSWYWSRPTGRKKSLSQGERRDLLTDATHIWGYFQQFLTEEHHHLPQTTGRNSPLLGWHTAPHPPTSAWHCFLFYPPWI